MLDRSLPQPTGIGIITGHLWCGVVDSGAYRQKGSRHRCQHGGIRSLTGQAARAMRVRVGTVSIRGTDTCAEYRGRLVRASHATGVQRARMVLCGLPVRSFSAVASMRRSESPHGRAITLSSYLPGVAHVRDRDPCRPARNRCIWRPQHLPNSGPGIAYGRILWRCDRLRLW